jgi:hypothetical protein
VLGLIYECASNRAATKALVEKILRELGPLPIKETKERRTSNIATPESFYTSEQARFYAYVVG